MNNAQVKPFIVGTTGMIIAIVIGYVLTTTSPTTTHPIGASTNTEVHVHGDFKMYLNDERIRFTDKKYQSSTEHSHHVSLHFHDGNDEVIHRHADNVTLVEFFASIGMKLTNECLTLDTGKNYCTNATNTLMLIVNNERTLNIENYIFAEEDRILLYYGDPKSPNIRDLAISVTDTACMYSGTCPERGTPPTEGCGLTCEVADNAIPSQNWLHTIKDLFSKH